ncbi:MAG: hypothetical protein PUE13_09545 [Clostridiales bacterium]|nr:hypothetical protein [Clostridiales bacterium]
MINESKVSLGAIVKELSNEGCVRSERQYRRDLEKFFELSGSSIERFRCGKKFLFTEHEAIVYKELLRLMDFEGFMSKYLGDREDEITDYDIVVCYERLEQALNSYIEKGKLDYKLAQDFLSLVDMSINYNFTKIMCELKEKFTALVNITNIYYFKDQNLMLKDMLDRFNPFFDEIYVKAMKDIINITKDKISKNSSGKVEEYLDENGKYSFDTALYVERDMRISEFLEKYPEEREKIEHCVGEANINKYFIKENK